MINLIVLFVVSALTFIITMAYYEKKLNKMTDAHEAAIVKERSETFKAAWDSGREYQETEEYFTQLKKELNIKL